MNLRPSGYEPDELPDCSTPHPLRRAFDKPFALFATKIGLPEPTKGSYFIGLRESRQNAGA